MQIEIVLKKKKTFEMQMLHKLLINSYFSQSEHVFVSVHMLLYHLCLCKCIIYIHIKLNILRQDAVVALLIFLQVSCLEIQYVQ